LPFHKNADSFAGQWICHSLIRAIFLKITQLIILNNKISELAQKVVHNKQKAADIYV